MKDEAETCPKCGSHNVDYGPLTDAGDDYVYYPITCNDCGCMGEERYDLLFMGTYAKGEDNE